MAKGKAVSPGLMLSHERLSVDEKHRARAAIALLVLAREALLSADREGPRGDMRLFVTVRPILRQIISLETQLVQFIDSPDPTPRDPV